MAKRINSKTTRNPNVGLMLVRSPRYWRIIKPASAQSFVLAGYLVHRAVRPQLVPQVANRYLKQAFLSLKNKRGGRRAVFFNGHI